MMFLQLQSSVSGSCATLSACLFLSPQSKSPEECKPAQSTDMAGESTVLYPAGSATLPSEASLRERSREPPGGPWACPNFFSFKVTAAVLACSRSTDAAERPCLTPRQRRRGAMEAGRENSSPLAVPAGMHQQGAAKTTSPPLHDFAGLSASPVTRTPLHDFPVAPNFSTTPTARPPLRELAPAQAASPQRHGVR